MSLDGMHYVNMKVDASEARREQEAAIAARSTQNRKDTDAASTSSASTWRSSISLLKEKVTPSKKSTPKQSKLRRDGERTHSMMQDLAAAGMRKA